MGKECQLGERGNGPAQGKEKQAREGKGEKKETSRELSRAERSAISRRSEKARWQPCDQNPLLCLCGLYKKDGLCSLVSPFPGLEEKELCVCIPVSFLK